MSFSLSAFIKKCAADAKAAAEAVVTKGPALLKEVEQTVLAGIPAVAAEVDKLAAVATPIAQVIDPSVAAGIKLADALVDEFAAAVAGATKKNADGTLTLVISADTVANGEKVYQDATGWLSSVGVKL